MGRFPVRRTLILLSAVTLLGAAPAVAAAQGTARARLAAAPAPVSGTLSMRLSGFLHVHGQPVTVPGRAISVAGVLRPRVPGVHIELRAWVDGRFLKRERLRLKGSDNGRFERYATTFSAPRSGHVKIVISHMRDRRMRGVQAHRAFVALDENVGPGATGRFVQLLQQRLSALHIYVPQSGVYDTDTANAVDAYRRLIGFDPGPDVGRVLVSHLLDGDGSFRVRFPGQGRHAEGDLSDQLLALIEGGRVRLIFPISSGKPSTPTILGSYRVYLREPGYLSDGMYYSDFFIRGYAIHGYDPAPDYPASHGCMRLPIPDAVTAYNWLALGDWVDTYYT